MGEDLLWLGLLLGFGVKAALFPFHGWLPRAHPVAISPVSALLSGAMTKLGLLGLYQSAYWFGPPPGWVGPVLLGLGLGGAVYALVRGLAEDDLKAALAYSSVENLGLMLAAWMREAPSALRGATGKAGDGAGGARHPFGPGGGSLLGEGFSLAGLPTLSPDNALVLFLVLASLALALLAEGARMPVDDPTTHLELTMVHEAQLLDHGVFGLLLLAGRVRQRLVGGVFR